MWWFSIIGLMLMVFLFPRLSTLTYEFSYTEKLLSVSSKKETHLKLPELLLYSPLPCFFKSIYDLQINNLLDISRRYLKKCNPSILQGYIARILHCWGNNLCFSDTKSKLSSWNNPSSPTIDTVHNCHCWGSNLLIRHKYDMCFRPSSPDIWEFSKLIHSHTLSQ